MKSPASWKPPPGRPSARRPRRKAERRWRVVNSSAGDASVRHRRIPMADGSRTFNFPPTQSSRLSPGEIVIDLFAGGGGASEALKQALGIDPALAYNHDEWAIGMHAANHPLTIHHREDIWHADPRRDVAGRPVGWFHASPDCTHFSQAKGGQPA